MTEIILNGVPVPFLGDPGIGINKKISDVPADIGRRTGSNTLTISIPGSTEEVRQLFNDLYDINVSQAEYDTYTPPRINTRLKAPAYIYQDMVLIFQGYARLRDIQVVNGVITFMVVLYSELPDLFNSVGERYLTDLDLSRFNHTYTTTNIANSWDTSIIENGSTEPFTLGNGYVYPMIEYGENAGAVPKPTSWYWNHFKPAVYAKTILDQIFEEAGYMYTSAFWESEEFTRLIIPFSNGEFKISEDTVTAQQFRANRITTDYLSGITNSRTTSSGSAVLFNNEVADPSNQYSTVSGQFTAANAATYTFEVSASGRFKYIGAGFNAGAPNSPLLVIGVDVEILKRDVNTGVVTAIGTQKARAAGGNLPNFTTGSGIVTTNSFTNAWSAGFTTVEVFLNAGDTVWIAGLRFPVSGSIPNSDLQMETDAGSYFLNQRIAKISYGETIAITDTLPTDFKQKEFLAAMVKMHNLYFDDNPNLANTLIVEPRPQFYQDLSIDLTDKFDISKEYTIQPQGLSKYRSYLFTYQQDNDFYNEDYNKRTGEVYGQLRLGIANEFLGDEYKIELPFAATPLISQLPTDRVVSAIFFRDTSGAVVDKAAKPRILIYGGLIQTFDWKLFDNASGSTTYSEYPYAGHHDTPYQPTQDLLFFPPKFFYFGGAGNLEITITNQNLYTQYYYQHIQEIDSEDAATARGYFNIQPGLFYQMGLRKLYFFQNAYWRILEIVDFSVFPPKLTEIQFLKALEISAPPPVEKIINGGTGDWVPIPDEGDRPSPGLTVPPPQNGTGVYGTNQVPASARNVLIVGNNITVGDEADGVVVLGGNQPVIESGINGGLFLNVDFTDTAFLDRFPQGSGLTAVSGEQVYLGGTITVSGDTTFEREVIFNTVPEFPFVVLQSADTPTYVIGAHSMVILDTTGGDCYIDLPNTIVQKEFTVVMRFAGAGKVTSSSSNIYDLDGSQVNEINLAAAGESCHIIGLPDDSSWQRVP